LTTLPLCDIIIPTKDIREVNKMTLFIIVGAIGGAIWYNLDMHDEWNHR
jgi:hypothetical protein